MAGDWIKMRGNLWDDPRVIKLVDMTDSSEAAVVGGLYWLWATADQHTEDGIMPGLSLRQIDRKTGLVGFGDALVEIGWVADHPEGVRIVNFDEHNGVSAKKRCATAKRVASHRSGNADVTQAALRERHEPVTPALAREREEKRREEKSVSKDTDKPRKRVSPPDGVCDSVWDDFLAIRKAKRAPITDTAIEGIKREAEKAGLTLEQALKECCARGWQGFRADWYIPVRATPSTTVPSALGRDPALIKLDEDAKKAAPIPADIKAKLESLRGRVYQ